MLWLAVSPPAALQPQTPASCILAARVCVHILHTPSSPLPTSNSHLENPLPHARPCDVAMSLPWHADKNF